METKSVKKFKENKLGFWAIYVDNKNRDKLIELRDKKIVWWGWNYDSKGYYHFNDFNPIEGKTIFDEALPDHRIYTVESLIKALKIKKMSNNKQIIGYKLIKQYPNREIGETCRYNPSQNDLFFLWDKDDKIIPQEFQPDVTPDWFEPVYEEKFTYKQGDYLYCKEDFQMNAGWIAYKKGRVYLADYNDSIVDEQNSTHTMPNTNYGGKTLSYYFRHATKEEVRQLYNSKKTLIIGTSLIKVEVSKGKIVTEGKTIDADNLSKLVHDMDGSKQYNLPWNVGFGSSVTIGCSSFKQGELNSVLEAYDEINNTSFALLPF